MVGEVLVLLQRSEGRSMDIKPIPTSGKEDNGPYISYQHSKAELQDILIEGDFHNVLNLLKARLPRETHVIINLLAQLNELNDRLAIGNISEEKRQNQEFCSPFNRKTRLKRLTHRRNTGLPDHAATHLKLRGNGLSFCQNPIAAPAITQVCS